MNFECWSSEVIFAKLKFEPCHLKYGRWMINHMSLSNQLCKVGLLRFTNSSNIWIKWVEKTWLTLEKACVSLLTHQTFTCLKSTIEILEKSAKLVQN